MSHKNFGSVSLQRGLINNIKEFIEQEDQTYGSVAEFLSEAARLRLQQLRELNQKVKENAK